MDRIGEFLNLCGQILKVVISDPETTVHYGYTTESYRADLAAAKGQHIAAIAEVKYYRSLDVPMSWIYNAALQTRQMQRAAKAHASYLMVSSIVSRPLEAEISKALGVTILDRERLYFYSSGQPDLIQSLDSLFANVPSAKPEADQKVGPATAPKTHERVLSPEFAVAAKHEGDKLCNDIRKVKAGKRAASDFERKVQAALEYIFADQLTGWTRQPPLDDGLRMDIAAKVAGNHDFWQEVIRDFKTRFVLFECKNYSNKICQEQIYTTEKYLFQKALRSVAVIISPKGPDNGAQKAIKGEIRESGKLILWLTVDEICKMLHLKDSGDEVHEVLASRLDEILLAIAR